ncbi:mycofactocin biosynthesis glycosyltransferase MftF [Nocardia wallacei]|uniref:mycofactocin biosynthesis glycosyltransferase MftF n=1 Tax=Nocardia wallacei TaxID=480035 RepID=UPI002453C3D2|nr:mycofactocin biosynthesis glycosyltransferase MftF [Nocardia wallacei]
MRVRLDPGVRRFENGRLLLGGAPARLLRLGAAGTRLLDTWLTGEPVAATATARALARKLLDAGILHPIAEPADSPASLVTLVVPVRDNPHGLTRLLAATRAVATRIVVDDGSASPITTAATSTARDASPTPAATTSSAARIAVSDGDHTPVTESTGSTMRDPVPREPFTSTAATPGEETRAGIDDSSRVTLVRHDRARGPAAARNAGWRRATTPLIAFLDSDVVPAPGWLDHAVPLFDDPAVAAVAPRVVSLRGGPVGEYEARRSALDMGPEPATVRPDGRVRYVPGAALVVRAETLCAVGGFDEALRFGEDVDLVWRLVDAGCTVRYQPLSIVHHEPRGSVGAFLRQRFGYGTSAAPLALRHPGLLPAAQLPAGAVATAALLLSGHFAAAILPAALTVARSAERLRRRGVPVTTAVPLAAAAQLRLARQLADTVRRTWWPLALCGPRGRRVLRAAALVAAMESLLENTDVTVRLGDELAYGLGVWAGCLRHRTMAPLLPRVRRERTGQRP